ncbi:MAG TPA: hypothetical protein VF432_07180 [Thermoanaerobaculia bacterium]
MTPRLRAQYPNEPWRWRADWEQRAVRESTEVGGWCLWGFAVVWNLFCLPLWFLVRWEWPMDPKTILMATFPIVGMLLLLFATHHTLRRRKYGVSVCHLDRVPIPVGSTLRGEIVVRLHEPPPAGFALRLASVRRTVAGSGKNRSVYESVLWQDEQTLTHGAMPSPNGLRVPFRFDIPFECTPCDLDEPEDLVIWRLTVSAEVPGIDYEAAFELPVFRTEDSRDELGPRVHSPGSWQPPREITVGPGAIVVRPSHGVTDYVFPIVFFALWYGALALFRQFGAPLIVIGFFGLIGLLVLLLIADLLIGRTTIAADHGALSIRRTWLGLGRRRVIPSSEIVRLEPAIGSTFGNRAYHNVRAILRDGRTRTVARHIRNRRDAEMLGERIAQTLGL